MREIIFRGKDLKTGEWRHGYLVGYSAEMSYIYGDYVDKNEVWEVQTKTVGQFIGFRDINEKAVFEGDIVLCSLGCPHEVVWNQEHGGVFFGGMPAFYLDGLDNGYAWTGSEEVVGNIYDKRSDNDAESSRL